jgi:hypothetical protein
MPLRKRLVELAGPRTASPWLAVEELARVEVTSEDPAHPVESALIADQGGGWRASQPGEQLIRLLFDEPQALHLVHLVFEERDHERVHEFSLRWSSDQGVTFHSIVRQQFSFSPSGATREVEDYSVDLDGVTEIELHINPDISGRPVVASLAEFRMR